MKLIEGSLEDNYRLRIVGGRLVLGLVLCLGRFEDELPLGIGLFLLERIVLKGKTILFEGLQLALAAHPPDTAERLAGDGCAFHLAADPDQFELFIGKGVKIELAQMSLDLE